MKKTEQKLAELQAQLNATSSEGEGEEEVVYVDDKCSEANARITPADLRSILRARGAEGESRKKSYSKSRFIHRASVVL